MVIEAKSRTVALQMQSMLDLLSSCPVCSNTRSLLSLKAGNGEREEKASRRPPAGILHARLPRTTSLTRLHRGLQFFEI